MVTAWHMLIARAKLRAGETVLVQAGGSGVGSAAIQIAKLFQATVYTTVGTAEKAKRAKELGADETILYRETDFVAGGPAPPHKRRAALGLHDFGRGQYV